MDNSKTLKKSESTTGQELREIKIINTNTRGESWRLKASRAIIDNNNIATLFDVTFVSGAKKIDIKGEKATYDLNTGCAEVVNDVVIELSDGTIARMDSLKIIDGLIKTHSPVIVEKGNMRITGKGVETDRSGNIRIIRDVKVELR